MANVLPPPRVILSLLWLVCAIIIEILSIVLFAGIPTMFRYLFVTLLQNTFVVSFRYLRLIFVIYRNIAQNHRAARAFWNKTAFIVFSTKLIQRNFSSEIFPYPGGKFSL